MNISLISPLSGGWIGTVGGVVSTSPTLRLITRERCFESGASPCPVDWIRRESAEKTCTTKLAGCHKPSASVSPQFTFSWQKPRCSFLMCSVSTDKFVLSSLVTSYALYQRHGDARNCPRQRHAKDQTLLRAAFRIGFFASDPCTLNWS